MESQHWGRLTEVTGPQTSINLWASPQSWLQFYFLPKKMYVNFNLQIHSLTSLKTTGRPRTCPVFISKYSGYESFTSREITTGYVAGGECQGWSQALSTNGRALSTPPSPPGKDSKLTLSPFGTCWMGSSTQTSWPKRPPSRLHLLGLDH